MKNANNVTLRSMTIEDTGGHGVESTGGGNIALSGVTIRNPFGACWYAKNIGGAGNRIDNGSLMTENNQSYHVVRVENTDTGTSTAPATITLDNSRFENQTEAWSAVPLMALGSSVMELNVQNGCLFTNLTGDAISINAGNILADTAVVRVNILNSTFRNSAANGSGNILIVARGNATAKFDISGNTFDKLSGALKIRSSGFGVIDGTVAGNTFQDAAWRDIEVTANDQNLTGGGFVNRLKISGNDFENSSREAIFITTGADSALDATIQGNRIGDDGAGGLEPVATSFVGGIRIASEENSVLKLALSDNLIRSKMNDDQSPPVAIEAEESSRLNATISNNTISADTTDSNLLRRFHAGAGPDTEFCLELTRNDNDAAADGVYHLLSEPGATFDLNSFDNSGTIQKVGTFNESNVTCDSPSPPTCP